MKTLDWLAGKYEVNKVTGCWKWLGRAIRRPKKAPRPACWWRGKDFVVARRVWIESRGRETTLLITHTCDNSMCVNPEHLEEGTSAQNSEDMVLRGRSLVGERNPAAKLTTDDVRQIVKDLTAGAAMLDVADRYGVTIATISHIATGKRWGRVTGIIYKRTYRERGPFRVERTFGPKATSGINKGRARGESYLKHLPKKWTVKPR